MAIGKYNLLSSRGADTIYGMPFRFNSLSDPGRKMYNRIFMADGPIISLIPGRPKFRKTNPELQAWLAERARMGTSNKEAKDNLFDETFLRNPKILNLDDDRQISEWLLSSEKSDTLKWPGNYDLRYYKFDPKYKEFLSDLDIILSTLAIKMGIVRSDTSEKNNPFKNFFIKGVFNSFNSADDDDLTTIKRGLRFYVNKNISVSDNISNSFGASMISGVAKSLSDMAKEAMFVLGDTISLSQEEKTAQEKTMTNKIAEMFSDLGGKIDGKLNLKGDLQMSIDSVLQGSNLIFPEIWKDSQYSKSIGCSFNFVSPYGSPEAIFQYVYLPFSILLALAAPRQVGTSSYTAPYILRVDCPGYMTSDLAAITSMDWTKGGNEQLFTKDGLPLAMTVNIQIKDLYPVLMLPRDFAHLRHNTGMHAFLDNMAGLSIERFTPVKDILDSIQARTTYVVGGGRRQFEGVKDWAYRISYSKIVENFR